MRLRWLKYHLLLLALLLGAASAGGCGDRAAAGQCAPVTARAADSGTLTDGNAHRHASAAMFSDGRSIYRICSSRPQRLLPTIGPKPERMTGRFVLSHPYKSTAYRCYDRRARRETAPFPSAASCDYYVIALRHILR
ncbi:MAG: hypothetical protein IJ710_04730 [Prevotella sp.]|nr:hypothetical protein [Prevotella sp.]